MSLHSRVLIYTNCASQHFFHDPEQRVRTQIAEHAWCTKRPRIMFIGTFLACLLFSLPRLSTSRGSQKRAFRCSSHSSSSSSRSASSSASGTPTLCTWTRATSWTASSATASSPKTTRGLVSSASDTGLKLVVRFHNCQSQRKTFAFTKPIFGSFTGERGEVEIMCVVSTMPGVRCHGLVVL